MRPYVFGGGTAVVTGAGSGIGEALAHGLADRGSHLALVDQHTDRLDRVARAVRQRHPGLRVETVVADLADHDATVAFRWGRQTAGLRFTREPVGRDGRDAR